MARGHVRVRAGIDAELRRGRARNALAEHRLARELEPWDGRAGQQRPAADRRRRRAGAAFAIAAVGAAFEAFGGGGPPIGTFVLAYTLGQVGALIPTPGGLGGTEGGLIGMFVVYGAPAAPTAAAILGYRVFQLGLPVILGLIAFGQIRRRLLDDELTASMAARFSHESAR